MFAAYRCIFVPVVIISFRPVALAQHKSIAKAPTHVSLFRCRAWHLIVQSVFVGHIHPDRRPSGHRLISCFAHPQMTQLPHSLAHCSRGLSGTNQREPDFPTPLRIPLLISLIKTYPHPDAGFLSSSLLHGFTIPFGSLPSAVSSPSPNLSPPEERARQALIEKECRLGRLFGPWRSSPWPDAVMSPVYVVPKSSTSPHEYRLIHNLSFSSNGYPAASVNSCIPDEMVSVSYYRLGEFISTVKDFGPNTLMFKFDVKSAFKLLCLHPDFIKYFGFIVDGQIFFDRTLPFGCRVSCRYWEMFAQFLLWRFRSISLFDWLWNYLDDFFACAPHFCEREIRDAFQHCKREATRLGLPLADDKEVAPTTRVEILGVIIDTGEGRLFLSERKLEKLRGAIRSALTSTSTTLRPLQSLLGLLGSAIIVFPIARAFLCRLYAFSAIFPNTNVRRHIPRACRADLKIWSSVLAGAAPGRLLWPGSRTVPVATDASPRGYGIVYGNSWNAGHWSWLPHPLSLGITVLELLPLLLFLRTHQFADHHIRLQCDNMAVVEVISAMRATDRKIVLFLREIAKICLANRLTLSAVHVPGVENVGPDLLSRNRIEEFERSFPACNMFFGVPAHIKECITSLLRSPNNLP